MMDFWNNLPKGVTDFLEPWIAFVFALLNPLLLLVVAGTVYLTDLQSRGVADSATYTVLVIVISLGSSLAGAVADRRYTKMTGQRLIVARGKTAIRALVLLVQEIQTLESRVRLYLERHKQHMVA